MKSVSIILIFSILTIFSCSSPKTITGEVNYLGSKETGTIDVNAAGYGRTKKEATENAERNAFHNLLFKGIPGSQYALPLVPDGENAQKLHKKYFNDLLTQDGYKRFMMTSSLQSGFKPISKGQENVTNQIRIDVTSLRRDLESNHIIRKFGY